MEQEAQFFAIFHTDDYGHIRTCSQFLPLEAKEREDLTGKHWRILFPGFQKLPVRTMPGMEQFILLKEQPEQKAFRISVLDCYASDGNRDGLFVSIEPEDAHGADELAEFEKTLCLGRMAGEFAHELNNTLTSICGWLQLLAMDMPTDDPRLEALEIARSEAKRTSRTAASLLAIARGEAGDEYKTLDLNALLNDVLVVVEPSLKAKEIKLVSKFDQLSPIHGSADEMRQVFMNLIYNAANAIEGEGCITVETSLKNCGMICASVSDTGCGIASEDLDKIFEAFYTTRPEKGGTGLGLFVSHRIIKQHNGDLLVDSNPGKGATFTVVLPAISEADGQI